VTAIGQTLCGARERLGLTLEEVERATHIRARHLEALERDAWDELPSPVQARGFLHNYADFLGLDPDAILLQYVEVQQQRRSALAAPTRPATAAGETAAVDVRRPRWLSADLLISSLVVLGVLAVLIWGIGRMMAGFRARTLEEAGGASLVLPTAQPTPSPTAEAALPEALAQAQVASTAGPTATLKPPPLLTLRGRVNVQLVIEQRSWVRVLVDGTEHYSGRAAAGEILEFQAQQTIEIITGNAGGVRVFFQGQDMGLMGEFDEAVVRIWAEEGLITPTPTTAPLITATQPAQVTATPTAGG
jgi:transcriptional regulator with XRE-family HTH domain